MWPTEIENWSGVSNLKFFPLNFYLHFLTINSTRWAGVEIFKLKKDNPPPLKFRKDPHVSCIGVTCVKTGLYKTWQSVRNCPSNAPTVSTQSILNIINKSRDHIFRFATMAANGISPGIILTVFCLDLFHHQSRSLVTSIKGGFSY